MMEEITQRILQMRKTAAEERAKFVMEASEKPDKPGFGRHLASAAAIAVGSGLGFGAGSLVKELIDSKLPEKYKKYVIPGILAVSGAVGGFAASKKNETKEELTNQERLPKLVMVKAPKEAVDDVRKRILENAPEKNPYTIFATDHDSHHRGDREIYVPANISGKELNKLIWGNK